MDDQPKPPSPASSERMGPVDPDPSELDDPNAGSSDREPGVDRPSQRPLSDNKAGG